MLRLFRRHIGVRILFAVGASLLLGMSVLALYQAWSQEQHAYTRHEQALDQQTETVSRAIQTIMLGGYADIAQSYADSLKQMPGIVDFRIVRTNGLEAFRDNQTLDQVNKRIGDEEFVPRDADEVQQIRVLPADDANLRRAADELTPVRYYAESEQQGQTLTLLLPIENRKD